MSIRVMTNVWDNFPGSGSELLAMLALADWCNDDGGSLHPSIAAVARKIRTSESQARRIVHGLIEKGWVEVVGNEFGGAPGATRQYRLNASRVASAPAVTGRTDAAPRTSATPSTDARDGSHGCAETGSTGASQTVNRSTNEPPVPPNPRKQAVANGGKAAAKPKKPPASDVADTFAVPDWMPMTEWRAWIEMRRAKGASKAPNTEDALKLAVRTLDKLRVEGQTPADVLDQSTLSGWTGLFAVKANQQRDLGKGRTGRDANGNAVALTSQQRNFKDVDYGENRIPSWLQDVADDVEAGSKR